MHASTIVSTHMHTHVTDDMYIYTRGRTAKKRTHLVVVHPVMVHHTQQRALRLVPQHLGAAVLYIVGIKGGWVSGFGGHKDE